MNFVAGMRRLRAELARWGYRDYIFLIVLWPALALPLCVVGWGIISSFSLALFVVAVVVVIRGLAAWCAILVAVVLVLASPALYFGYRSNIWLLSDYFALFIPLVTWVLLTFTGVGQQSLSHVVELFGLVILMAALVSMRIFFGHWIPVGPEIASYGVLVFGVAVAVLLRAFMPYMPE